MQKKNSNEGLFERIAPAYGLFYNYQRKRFNAALEKAGKDFDLTTPGRILDVGCGTGALAAVLRNRGFEVTGVDPAEGMIRIARRNTKNQNINFIPIRTGEKLPFADKSFDISIASYVAHGLRWEERKLLYREMGRVTKDWVIIHDYNKKRSFFTTFIEHLEGGDYLNFIEDALGELEPLFSEVREINVSPGASWYICRDLREMTGTNLER